MGKRQGPSLWLAASPLIEKEFRPPLWRPFSPFRFSLGSVASTRIFWFLGFRTRAPRPRLLFGERHREHSMLAPRGLMRRRNFTSLMKLGVEANAVIALRMMKLLRGGKSGRREAELMVSEKIHAAIEAAASLMTGASGSEIVHRYRQHVARNAKRLGRPNSSGSRKRTRPK